MSAHLSRAPLREVLFVCFTTSDEFLLKQLCSSSATSFFLSLYLRRRHPVSLARLQHIRQKAVSVRSFKFSWMSNSKLLSFFPPLLTPFSLRGTPLIPPLSSLCPFSLASCLFPSIHPWLWVLFLHFMSLPRSIFFFPPYPLTPSITFHHFSTSLYLFSSLLIFLSRFCSMCLSCSPSALSSPLIRLLAFSLRCLYDHWNNSPVTVSSALYILPLSLHFPLPLLSSSPSLSSLLFSLRQALTFILSSSVHSANISIASSSPQHRRLSPFPPFYNSTPLLRYRSSLLIFVFVCSFVLYAFLLSFFPTLFPRLLP